MSTSFQENPVFSEKKYSSEELMKGFARFSNSNIFSSDDFTKNWLWHSLMLCQHFVYTEKSLSKEKIRKILNLEIPESNYLSQEKTSFIWLQDKRKTHPEMSTLVESLLTFLEKTSTDPTFSQKVRRDYKGFGMNTMFVAASAGVSCLFLPNIFMVGGVFVACVVVGSLVKKLINKQRSKGMVSTVEKKIVELDNMDNTDQVLYVRNLINSVSSAPFSVDAKVKEYYDHMVLLSQRFVKLYQKHPSNLESFMNLENIWKNTMPSLAKHDFNDEQSKLYAISVLGKMEYLLRNYVADLMALEVNDLRVEDAFWSAKVASEQELKV